MSKQVIILTALGVSLLLSRGAAADSSASAAVVPTKAGPTVNCAEDYGGAAASCQQVPCNGLYRSFLGTWSGQFWAYVRNKSTAGKNVYRPYQEAVTYAADDCLRNTRTGDTFIVGHQTERYPPFEGLASKTATNLLITGEKTDGTPFLRVTMEHHTYDYTLRYKDGPAKLSVWELQVPASNGQPQMRFTTIDGRDFTAHGHTRDVTVTMMVGPISKPYWQGVIAYGSHTKE